MESKQDIRSLIIDDDPLEGYAPPRKAGRPSKATATHCGRGHEMTPSNVYEYRRRGLGSTVSRRCKTCVRDDAAGWKVKNPERYKELQARGNKAKAWTPEQAERNRWWRIERCYGITKEQFDAIWVLQNGLCAICALALSPRAARTEAGVAQTTNTAVVDHCHATGKVRGILCPQCNHALGHMRDSPELLEFAAAYLRKNGGQP